VDEVTDDYTIDDVCGMLEDSIGTIRRDSTASIPDYRKLLNDWYSVQVKKIRAEAGPAISFAEGKKIYDQGWNDGIDQFQKSLNGAIAFRMLSR
jgi:hypothetical protein